MYSAFFVWEWTETYWLLWLLLSCLLDDIWHSSSREKKSVQEQKVKEKHTLRLIKANTADRYYRCKLAGSFKVTVERTNPTLLCTCSFSLLSSKTMGGPTASEAEPWSLSFLIAALVADRTRREQYFLSTDTQLQCNLLYCLFSPPTFQWRDVICKYQLDSGGKWKFKFLKCSIMWRNNTTVFLNDLHWWYTLNYTDIGHSVNGWPKWQTWILNPITANDRNRINMFI